MEVLFYIWSKKEEDYEVVSRFATAFKNKIKKAGQEVTTSIKNLSSYGDTVASTPHFILGKKVEAYVTSSSYSCWVLPEPAKLEKKRGNEICRKEALDTLDKAVLLLSDSSIEETEPTVKAVEVKGKTFGEINTDFMISEREAEYLKKIKDLLSGSKIVVSKGDTRIEIQ